MTTKILIINDRDSNNAQHLLVTVSAGPRDPVIEKRLAPGEMYSQWVATGHDISIKEIGEPKPKE